MSTRGTKKKRPQRPKKLRTLSQINKGAKRKGASGERAAAFELQPIWPDAKRGIGQMRSANEVPDVDGTPIWWEVKNTKAAYNIYNARKQAEAASDGRRPTMVLARKTGEPWMVCMTITQFRAIMLLLEQSTLDRDKELLDALQKSSK